MEEARSQSVAGTNAAPNAPEKLRQQAFLLLLSDTLRPLADPVAIQGAATRLLREHFAAGWCYYVEWDETGTIGYVLHDDTQPGLPSMVGRHDVSDAPEFTAFLRSGRLLNVADFASFSLFTPRVVARYTGIGIHACLNAPLVKDGRLLAVLTLADTTPREWSAEAIALIGEVAERTWATLARARAEQALRQSEQCLRLAVEAAELGTWEWDVEADQVRWNARHFTLLGLDPRLTPLASADFVQFVHPDDRSNVEHCLRVALAELVAYAAEFRVVTAQGHVRWMSGHGQAIDRAPDGYARRLSGVMLDITARKQAEAADQLQLRFTQQQQLIEAVLTAQEEERRSLSESLHNGLGQLLFATKLRLDRLHVALLAADPPLAATSREAEHLLSDAIRRTRVLSHELVPLALEEFGLAAALQDVCRQLSTPQLALRSHVVLDAKAPPLPGHLQLALYRMAQELGLNIVKHAHGATEASLELETTPGFVLLRAEANGVGFAGDPAGSLDLGLRPIRDRVALLNGTLDFSHKAGFGTFVRLRLPLPA